MIRTQRWTTDSGCANPASGDVCVFLEEWDDSQDELTRVQSFKAREKVCSWHAADAPSEGYNRVLGLNRRKNAVFSQAQSIKSAITPEMYQWTYSPDGTLMANFGNNLSNAQKTQLRNAASTQFGSGRVVVQ